MLADVQGKVAVITGGASGIGLAMARLFQAEGMEVVLADYEQGPLQAAAAELGVLGVTVDVRDPAALDALAATVKDRFGAAHLLCNNAGVSVMAGVRTLNAEDWRWTFDVNLFGVVNGVRSFLPLLDANPDGGHIVNTGSLSSLYGTRAQSAYGASKFAVGAFTEVLAAELAGEGSGVGVSLLCPGPVRTNIGTSVRNRTGYAPSGRDPATPDPHEQSFRGDLRDDIWITADEAAAAVLAAVRAGDFWIITHPWLMQPVEARHAAIMAAANRSAG